ncbi:MAG: cellulose binding domain-containing protein [Bacilli bacterium]|nr:cellulose binding domain-containing protein [Bacilli bacterium]
MRRKRKTKIILIIVLILTMSQVAYAYLKTSLNITGQVGGNYDDSYVLDNNSTKDLTITNLEVNSWQNGNIYYYQYTFNVNNVSSIDYDNFKLLLNFSADVLVTNIWNYSYEEEGSSITIINNSYDLNTNNTLIVSFILQTSVSNLKLIKIKISANKDTNLVTSDQMQVTFNKTNSWGTYTYQYEVIITNNSGNKITYWQIELILPNTTIFKSGWGATYEMNNSVLTIKNASYNGRIENKSSVTIGLQLTTTDVNFKPSNYSVLIR